MAETKFITALHLELEDESTGAVTTFHTLSSYYVHLPSGYVQVRLSSYASAKAHAAGKAPVGEDVTLEWYGAPPRGEDASNYLYQYVCDPKNELLFSGAEFIYLEEE